ncbi:unnamed protein product [Sympodiomycopsis kandeliae]
MSSSSSTTRQPPHSLELTVGISAVLRASIATTSIFKTIPSSLTKSDSSPVTLGDFAAQSIVNTLLAKYFPEDGIVGEEEAGPLRQDAELRGKVQQLVKTALTAEESKLSGQAGFDKKWSDEDWSVENNFLDALDKGNFAGGNKGRFWALDPIDGTKGFLRGGQYAICLALIEDGDVKLGVMACPNLPYDVSTPKPAEGDRSGVQGDGTLFVSVKGHGSYHRAISPASSPLSPISLRELKDTSAASFCESVEAGHSSQSTNSVIASLLNITSPPVRMDSQAKYASVSRGDGDIYLRLPTGKGEYQEKIWDHASGYLLCKESGAIVSDVAGRDLNFGVGRTLKNNKGVVVAHKDVHAKVLAAVKEALQKEGRGYLAE